MEFIFSLTPRKFSEEFTLFQLLVDKIAKIKFRKPRSNRVIVIKLKLVRYFSFGNLCTVSKSNLKRDKLEKNMTQLYLKEIMT